MTKDIRLHAHTEDTHQQINSRNSHDLLYCE